MKTRKKKIVFGAVGLFVLAGVLALAVWLDWRNDRVVLKLADYRRLTCESANPEELTEQILEALVENSRFGGGLDERTEENYRETMDYFAQEAEYFSLSLSEYLERFYDTTEEEFRESVRESAEQAAKEEAVLEAVADEEGIVLTDEEFEAMLPDYMESYGYTDEAKFLREHDENEIREAMRREKALDRIVEYLKEK